MQSCVACSVALLVLLLEQEPTAAFSPARVSRNILADGSVSPESLRASAPDGTESWDDKASIAPPAPPEGWMPPLQEIVVVPELKLAFCLMEKNAHSSFFLLFNALNGLDSSPDAIATPWNGSYYNSFDLRLEDLTAEDGWKWGVFLRNPHLRYLSAYFSKCVHQENDVTGIDAGCEPADALVSENASVDALRENFAKTVDQNLLRREDMSLNRHYAEQSSFCGGFTDLSRFSFVGQVNDDMHDSVCSMVEQWGGDSAKVDAFFPEVSNHRSNATQDWEVYYEDKELVSKVFQLYANDYALEGMMTEYEEMFG